MSSHPQWETDRNRSKWAQYCGKAVLGPIFFIMAADWTTREVDDKGKTGIQWTLSTQLWIWIMEMIFASFSETATYASQEQQPGADRSEHRLQGKSKRKPKSCELITSSRVSPS